MNPRTAAARIFSGRAETSSAAPLDVSRHLSPEQRKVWECKGRIISLLCGRRAGKTYFAALWLLVGALGKPGSLSVYLALTKSSARRIVWKEMVKIGTGILGIDKRHFRDSTMEVRLPNGADIVVTGTDDVATIETWRGTHIWRAVVDEMGSQRPDLIEYFVEDILWPALGDDMGRLALLGTPGLICDGYWWEMTKPEAIRPDPDGFRWTAYENPALPDIGDFIQEMFDNPKHSIDNAESSKFKREWLAEWIVDWGALCYPYDAERNGIAALPTRTETGILIPPRSWRHVIGNDVGVVDECAWVVWAWHPAYRGVIGVDSFIAQLDPDPAAAKAQEMRLRYPGCEFVLDVGGMGKSHERIYRARYGIPIVPADKPGKASAIRELRGDLLSGAAKLLDTPALNPLRSQWAVLGWCPKQLVHAPGVPDHLADAGLYGHRRTRHWTHNPDHGKPALPLGSAQRRMVDARARLERDAAREMRGRGRGGSERLDR